MKKQPSITAIIFTAIMAFANPVNSQDLKDFGVSRKSLFKSRLPFHNMPLPFHNTVRDEGAEIILSTGNVLSDYQHIDAIDSAQGDSRFIVSHEGLIWSCYYSRDHNMSCIRTSWEPMFK